MLARIGSVRRVAEQMHATPGAISMRVRALEAELGVTLFLWDRKTLQLSDDGTRLLRHAEHLLEATRSFEQVARNPGAAGGRVRVGVIETVVHSFLPAMMKAVASKLPGVALELSVDMGAPLTERLMRGEVDLVLRLGGESDSPLSLVQPLMELPVHWIARRGVVPVRDPLRKVLGLQLLTPMPGSQPHAAAVHLVQQLAAKQGVSAADLRITGSPSLAALVSLVREGVGVAIVPGLLVKEQLDSGELVALRLPSPPPVTIGAWYPKNAAPTVPRVAEVIGQACKSYCRRLDEHWARALGSH